jgi:PadR family transcriptional regulator, regulatory protein PadR
MAKSKAPDPPLRISATEELILDLLVNGRKRELYGLEMVKLSDGELKRGTVYVTLQRMEDKGLVESREEENTPEYVGIPRRLYKPTGLGARAFRGQELLRAHMAGAGLRLRGA